MDSEATGKRPPNRLGRRLLVRTLLFSLVLTVLFTVFQALMEYRQRISVVQNNMEQIADIYRRGIAASLWNYDHSILAAQIDGIRQMHYINYAAVMEDGRIIYEAGARKKQRVNIQEIPLTYDYRGRDIPLGTLYVQADRTGIIKEVIGGIAIIFLFQLATVTVTAFFLFRLFTRMVTKHLYSLANYFSSPNVAIDRISTPVRLDKKQENDEIDVLVNSFNEMREYLTLSYSELKQSRDRYSILYNQTPVLLQSIDRTGALVEVNDFWLKTLQYERDEVLGRQVADFYTEASRKYSLDIVQPAFFQNGFCKDIALQFVKKNGQLVDVLLSAIGERDQSGNVVRSLAVIQDITERLALENQLLQAQKMEAIGLLAGGVAHDFNNILTAIIGYSHLSLMKLPSNDPVRLNLEQILESSNRAAVLTQSLLAFSRRQPVNLVVIDLNQAIKDFEKFIHRLIREDIALETVCTEGALPVMADRGQIEQVIMNLVTNARDAMPHGGKLLIETRRVDINQEFMETHGFGEAGEYALVSVADTGIGMDEQTRSRIFEPFFTTKEQGKGTGLGLSMVYGTVKKHNGYINVYSEPGKGTTLKIYLPRVRSAVRVDQIKAQDSIVRDGTETILLAEDDAAIRNLNVTVLKESGYTVIEAANGADAVSRFKENKDNIELVILDGIMPMMNGREVFRAIKDMVPNIKCIFMSGYSEDIFNKDGVSDEEAEFILKPATPAALLKKIREVLEK